ncbi:unnamed protein product [Merluccius merluccius]
MPVLWVMPVATMTPGEQNATAALAPAVSLALDDLKRQGGSQIHLQLLDSQCDSATALKGLFDAMWEDPGHMIIFGGVCPQVTAVLARSVHALNMVQLSFTAVSAGLSDRRRYPSLFSTVPSDRAFNTALVQLLHHFGWIRVALLTQDGVRLSQMRKNLVHQLMEANVQMAETQSVTEDPCLKLQKLKTPLEYEQAYLSQIRQEGAPGAYLHGYAYDGVWVMAKAVSHITERLKHKERHSTSRNLSITQEQTADMLLVALKQTRFEGVTGPVLFQNGERVASIELRQFQATRETLVGQYNTFTQKLRMFPDALKFSGSGPAQDGTVVRLQRRDIGQILYTVVTSAAALVFIASLTVLFRSISDCICCREPRGCCRPLDHLLFLGILLTLSWVPLAGLDGALVPICMLDPLCSSGADVEKDVRLFSDCCVSANMDLWLTALYAYKGPLLGLGCFIACSIGTRKDVSQEVTRENRRLALSVCAVAMTSGLGALGSLLSSHQPQLHFLLPSLAILTGTTSLLLWGVHAKPGPAGPREAEPPVAPGEVSCRVPPTEGATPQGSPDSQEGRVQLLANNNHQLRRRRTQLDEEIETITMEIDSAPPPDHQISEHSYTHDSPSRVGPIQRSSGPSTITQISYQDPPNTPNTSRRCRVRAEELNSPEHVRRRMSMQLPILHHAYHPVIGGMATSRSSLLGSPDTATALAPTQCTCTVPPVDSQVQPWKDPVHLVLETLSEENTS